MAEKEEGMANWDTCSRCSEQYRWQEKQHECADVITLRAERDAAIGAKEKAEGAMCRAREIIAANHPVGFTMPHQKCCAMCEAYKALSTSSPCPHEARVKVLEEALEWALTLGIADLESDRWRNELRRRAGGPA